MTVGIGVILYYFVALGPGGSISLERLVALLLVLDDARGADEHRGRVDRLEPVARRLRAGAEYDVRWRRLVPGALGTFIGMGVVLAVSILVWNGPGRIHRLAVVTIVVGLPGLFFTYTRAPILATIVAASLMLVSRTGARLFGIALLVTGIAVVIVFWGRITSSSAYQKRFAQTNTVEIRAELERWSLKLAGERPLLGWGYGSFDRTIQAADFNAGKLQRSDVVSSTSHNTFLTILVQYGVDRARAVRYSLDRHRLGALSSMRAGLRTGAGCCSEALPPSASTLSQPARSTSGSSRSFPRSVARSSGSCAVSSARRTERSPCAS